ncbi:MAG TPA: UGSC family (seleno)protein [Methylomirabilota bacterium]|nr:UGSC family (seleno)protein [Methylomirabilota bacterium]
MLRASAVAERAGVPTASLVCEGFLGQAATTATGLGLPGLPTALVPGHVDVQTAEELARNVAAVTVDAVVRSLTEAPAAAAGEAVAEPGSADIVFEGSFDEVNRFFYENDWSDGLPIVPPTPERVAEFLRFADRAAETELGVLLPDRRRATVWSVAVNGVMAGCRPEYMPVLVALVEAMADPRYGVEHSGNTPGAETLIILNGPIIKELGFNYEQGALRDGVQANTTIGRFWRLYLRNVAGFLHHRTDKATFGNTWRVVLAENEDALRRIAWSSVAEDEGAAPGANAVTISRYTGGGVVASVFGTAPAQMLPYLADALVGKVGWELLFTVGMGAGSQRPLLILSPILAETLARGGLDKAALKRQLFELARVPAARLERYVGEWTNLMPGRPSLAELVKAGQIPALFAESEDPGRLVPIVCRPEDFMVAVSGDPLRTNAYAFAHNGILGYPTTKPIRLPADWPHLLRAARAR